MASALETLALCGEVVLLLVRVLLHNLVAMYLYFRPGPRKCVRGQVALVTGAGHGLGKELSLQLGRLGAKVICCDINEAWNNSTVADVKAEGGDVRGYVCDVSSETSVKDVMLKVRQEVGDVDILINNAGIMPCKPFLKHSQAEVDRIFGINIMSSFYTVRQWLPVFMERGSGHIVALSSAAGLIGCRNLVPYCSTKYAVKGFMDGLRQELRHNPAYSGIKLTVVHPFVLDTGLAHKPVVRFKAFQPIMPPAEAASLILDSVRRDEYMVHLPYRDCLFFKLGMTLPLASSDALEDFMYAYCDEHDT